MTRRRKKQPEIRSDAYRFGVLVLVAVLADEAGLRFTLITLSAAVVLAGVYWFFASMLHTDTDHYVYPDTSVDTERAPDTSSQGRE